MADENEISVSFHLKGFDKKVWSNPTKTTSRIYIYKIDGNIKIECGYFDLNKQFYCPPDKRRKHADHNVVICGEKESKAQTLMTEEVAPVVHVEVCLPLEQFFFSGR